MRGEVKVFKLFNFTRKSEVLRDRMETAILALRDSYDDLDTILSLQENEIDALTEKLEELDKTRTEVKGEISNLQKMTKETNAALANIKSIYSTYERTI